MVKKARKSSWDIPFSKTSSGIFATYNTAIMVFWISNRRFVGQMLKQSKSQTMEQMANDLLLHGNRSVFFVIHDRKILISKEEQVATTVSVSLHKQTNKQAWSQLCYDLTSSATLSIMPP